MRFTRYTLISFSYTSLKRCPYAINKYCFSFSSSFDFPNKPEIFGGIKEYIPSPNDPFQIPYLWILNHLLILYFTLHYASDDLSGIGQQMIYRAGGRIKWWVSKCIWNFTSVVSYYIVSYHVLIALALYYQLGFIAAQSHDGRSGDAVIV